MKRCPTCGHELERNFLSADDLLDILRTTREMVYRTNEGRWFVSRGKGEVSGALVHQLADDGKISPCYSNTKDAYHVGRTWDVDRTMAARKKLGKDAPNYFIGDPPEPTAESDDG